eukprot:gene12379-19146_t
MLPLTVDAVGFAVEFAWAAGESVVVPYLVDHLGVSFSTAALVFAVNPVVAVFLQPALGEFSDRLQTRCSIGGRIPLIVGLCVTSLLGILTLVTAEVLLGGRKVPTAVLAFVGFGVLDVSHDCLLIPARAFISDMTADAPEAEEALHNRFSLAQTLGRALALFAGALPIAKVPLFAGSGEVRTFRGLLSLTGLIIVASGASATFLGIRYLRSSRARQDHQQAELSERLSCAASGDAVSVSESNASIVELTVSAVTAEDCVPLGGVQDATDASEGGGGESEPAAVPSVKEPIDWKVLGTLTLVQCFAWYGFMANNFYWTEWVGLTATLPGTNSVLHTAMTGLMAQALSGCAASWVLPAANRRHGVKKTYIVAMILSSVTLGLSCFAKGWFSVLCLMPMGVAYIVVLTNAQLLYRALLFQKEIRLCRQTAAERSPKHGCAKAEVLCASFEARGVTPRDPPAMTFGVAVGGLSRNPMVRLTVDLAAKCAKYTNPLKEREVDLRGNRIPEIENLGILEDGFDSIDLSDNDIATLGNFPLMKRCKTLIIHTNRVQRMAGGLGTYLPNLENLVLNSNRLRELEDLAPLADLPSLQRLTLLDNLVSKHPDYRPYVIARLPALKHLDFKKVKPVERERALKQFGRPVKSHAGAAAVASSSAPPGPRDMTDAERKEIADLIASAKSLDEIKKIEEER